MLMPEASVDENDGAMPRQDDVRRSRQVSPMQAKPISHPMQRPPHGKLRSGVLFPDRSHDP